MKSVEPWERSLQDQGDFTNTSRGVNPNVRALLWEYKQQSEGTRFEKKEKWDCEEEEWASSGPETELQTEPLQQTVKKPRMWREKSPKLCI